MRTRHWALLAALAPAVAFAGLGVQLNHFALFDDWVSVARAHAAFVDNFILGESGRFNFFYWLFHWLVIRILAPAPWAFSLANGTCVVVAAWQLYALAGRWGGSSLAGIAGAWLFTLNAAAAENLFTLGKAEPKQLVCWLAALALIGRPLEGRPGPGWAIEATLLAAATASAILFKESGLLLGVPLAVCALMAARGWPTLSGAERRRALGLIAGCAVPLMGGAILTLRYGLQRGSYAREQVMGQPLGLGGFDVAVFRGDAFLGLLLTAGLVAGLIRLVTGPRGPVVLGVSQLMAVVGFYTLLRTPWPYYYYPAAALAGLVLGIALFPSQRRSAGRRTAAVALVVALATFGAARAVAGASALAGWSWLHERLVSTVVGGSPPRALFYESGPWELLVDARLAWEDLHRLPLVTGVLDPSEPPGPKVRSVAARDLRPGDWILEEFGARENERAAFRGLGVTRPAEYGLMNQGSQTMLPIRPLHRFAIRFRLPSRRFTLIPDATGSLEWRIYEVTDLPCVGLEGLAADRWMGSRATLWVRRGSWERVILRFWPLTARAPAGGPDNELRIWLAGRVVASCPVRTAGVHECAIEVARLNVGQASELRVLQLEAARTFTPQELGMGADTRALSFNFQPSWDQGAVALLEPDGARAARSCGAPRSRESASGARGAR